VALFQRGAVDGLAMVPPWGDAAYHDLRPGIAIGPPRGAGGGALDLDGFFGLHPAMAPLRPLWDEGRLAVVHACGSPHSTRSHFDAQDYMESGTPGVKSTADGWLGRGLVAMPPARPTPVRALALSPKLPRTLRGAPGALAVLRLDDARVGEPAMAEGPMAGTLPPRAPLPPALESLYQGGPGDLVGAAGREAFEVARLLERVGAGSRAAPPGMQYPRSRLGQALAQIARLMKADVGLEVAFAEVGGWDTHVGQGGEQGQLALRLGDLAQSLGAFCRDLGPRMDDVVLLTMSEFGRTVRENGNRGTDHGHGTAMLVLGGPVRGGRVFGRWPGLGPGDLFEGRDLAVTTDFRHLFAEVARRHLGVPEAAPLFPGFATAPADWPAVLG
jgi:uncharacterized protein (DUF1501 family)